MLRIDDRLASYAIGAGEPWIMGVQMKMMTGSAVIDWSNRRLVLSFYEAGRVLFDQIEGVYSSDASGAYFAFIRDGRFSESLLGKSVQVELAERLQNGRNIIATGALSVATSSDGVASYGSIIGRVEARFTLYFTASNLIALVEQELLPYGGVPITPGPVITSPAGINSDGTPQVGETFTGVDPVGNGPVVARRWIAGGSTVAATQTYTAQAAGSLRFEADIRGPDNTTATSGSTITVAAATTPVSITGTPPITGTVGQPYSFTPGTANGAGTKTFALTGGTLLGGLSFSTTTGAISGTPNVAGTMSGIVVRVTDSTGSASTMATNVTIASTAVPVAISGTPPTTGQVDTAYSFTPSTSGGTGTKVFSLAGGTLVAGLSLNTATGAITGTPTAAGSITGLSVRVTDDAGNAATSPTTVTIAAASSSNQWNANSADISANGNDWFADGTRSGGGGTSNPALTLTGPVTIGEGNPSAAAPALTLSGPATLAEGNPSAPALTLSGPATLTEGN